MTPAITFDDYTRIGTMETALSEHADEVFFELSAEKQKIAEKIFKCLTETDRENRETRRATTIEKLCAVAAADFADVASIIDAFRPEGRTFLMPPPEVELNKNTLIDISHESLIRKWERLKKWVEEEGQSSRTYRRLAEDALLHKQGKVGFWSEPELSDALDWRADFEPNETWAQLYKEKGERQYRASFAESMQYLDDSKDARDAEIAEDERRQNALRKYAKNLHWAVIGLIFVLLGTVGVAAFALYQMNEAVQVKNALSEEKRTTDDLYGKLQVEKQNTDSAFHDLRAKKEELDESLEKQKEATDKAEEEKLRADTEAKHAILSEAETEKALEQQKRLAAEAKEAKINAEKKQREAERSRDEARASEKRAETNRTALTFLEQRENEEARVRFETLRRDYENPGIPMEEKARTDGKWWALHNLGIVYSELNETGTPKEKTENLFKAAYFYDKAIGTLNSASKKTTSQTLQSSGSTASFDKRENEINRSLIATYRRRAQLFRMLAEDATTEQETYRFNTSAIEAYGDVIKTLKKEPPNAKQLSYSADVWVELADTHYDLYAYEAAVQLYKVAEEVYDDRNDYDNQVAVLKKWADAEIARANEESVGLLKKAVKIQEDEMHLSPVNLEIADTFDRLANAIRSTPRAETNELSYYSSLFDLIRKVNFTAYNKIISISDVDVKKLANAYVGIGKCKRAEEVYLFAIDKIFQPGDQSAVYILESKHHVYFYRDLAVFYQNVLHDDQNAQKYFDKLALEIEKESANPPLWEPDIYFKTGDFYAAKGNFARAESFYKYALQAVDNSWSINKDFNTADDNDRNLIIETILTKAEIIAKTARLYEAQNKMPEAEAKYLEALILIESRNLKFHPLAAKYLIAYADFLDKTGDKKKALEFYIRAETVLNPGDGAKQFISALEKKFPLEKMALEIYVQKKLGDFNRETNARVAAGHYKKALELFEEYLILVIYQGTDKESTRYSSGAGTTKAFRLDWIEVLEALGNMEGVEGKDGLKAKAQGLRKDLDTVEDRTCANEMDN